MDVQRALTYVRRSTPALRKLTAEMCDNDEIISAIIKKHGGRLGLQKASPRLKNNIKIIVEAVRDNTELFFTLDAKWQQTRDVLEAAIENVACNPLEYVPKYMINDEACILLLIDICGDVYNVIPAHMRHNYTIAVAAVNKTALALHWIAPKFLKNRQIIIAAAKSAKTIDRDELWMLIPEEFRSDPVVLDAFSSRYFLINVLLKHYHSAAAAWLVTRYPMFLKDMKMYWNDSAVVLAAAAKQGYQIVYADIGLFTNPAFLMKLCTINPTTNFPKAEQSVCELYKILIKKYPIQITADICASYICASRG